MKIITIEISGGCVTDVLGLPEGYDYEIIDHDNDDVETVAPDMETCKKCRTVYPVEASALSANGTCEHCEV
jgi:hypothetical protein